MRNIPAYSRAVRIVRLFVTQTPSSLRATAPAFLRSRYSEMISPPSPFVVAAIG